MCLSVERQEIKASEEAAYVELRYWTEKFGFFREFFSLCGQSRVWEQAEKEWSERRPEDNRAARVTEVRHG